MVEAVDWSKLSFELTPTPYHCLYTYSKGKWDAGQTLSTQTLTLSLFASSLHYGQACFEGLKAFTGPDGRIRLFRPDLNHQRFASSCVAVSMPVVPLELFLSAVTKTVDLNRDFVPPQGINGALYVRPFMYGSGGVIGLEAASEYHFVVAVTPVGDYYNGGLGGGKKAVVQYGFDRAAPCGSGHVKLSGNYAPVISVTDKAKAKGYAMNLFLDPKENKFIEEFATSNFVALSEPDAEGKRTYVTPKSRSILPSITNRTLSEIAVHWFGWNVSRRLITWEDVRNGKFDEIAAVGTAVVITPISIIDCETFISEVVEEDGSDINTLWDVKERVLELGNDKYEKAGDSFAGFKQLFDIYRGLQTGVEPDRFGWLYPKEGL